MPQPGRQPDEPFPDPASEGTSQVWIDHLREEPDAQTVWNRLERRYVNRLRVYAAQQLGPALRRDCEPEDVVNEAWMRAVRNLDKFQYRRRGSFLDWLRKQVYWIVQDRVRVQGRRPPPPAALEGGTDDDHRGADPADEAIGPASEVGARELNERLAASLETVPSLYRQVLVAHYLENRSVSEIAQELGRRPNTVSQQLRRGIELWRRGFRADPLDHV